MAKHRPQTQHTRAPHVPRWADLDGVPFVAYYCTRCAQNVRARAMAASARPATREERQAAVNAEVALLPPDPYDPQ